MKKRISIFSVVLLVMLAWWDLPVGASPVVPGTTQLHIAATADATGRGVAVDGMGVAGVGVTISGTATISFQASMDQGATWVSVTCTSLTAPASSTSTATTGAYSCPVSGRTHLRTPLTGCAACTVTVNVTTSPATAWNVGFDVNGNVLVSIPCISGESICVVTSPNSYLMTRNVMLSSGKQTADFQVRATPGYVDHMICIGDGSAAASGTIIIYDNTVESGTALFTLDITTLLAYNQPMVLPIGVKAATGVFLGYTSVTDVACTVFHNAS